VDDELTEEALEKMLMQIVGHIDAMGDKTSLIPKWVMYRPADLKALGLTHEDIVELIKKESKDT
jgi:hypothetical protein